MVLILNTRIRYCKKCSNPHYELYEEEDGWKETNKQEYDYFASKFK